MTNISKYWKLLPLDLLLLLGAITIIRLNSLGEILSVKSFATFVGMLLIITGEILIYKKIRKGSNNHG